VEVVAEVEVETEIENQEVVVVVAEVVAVAVAVDQLQIKMLLFWKIAILMKMFTNQKNLGLLNSMLLGVVIGKQTTFPIISKKLEPEWNKVASELKGEIKVAKVDATA
jgi:hypothetical protein